MKKSAILGAVILLLSILDNSLIPFISIKGVYPSLIFVFVLSYSIINNKWEALWIGMFSGVIQDIYFTNVFGVNALFNMLICVLASEIGSNIIKRKVFIPFISCIILSILKGIGVFITFYAMGVYMDYKLIFFTSIYNAVLILIIYNIVYRICTTKSIKRKWKF
ncbi:rod shape-determining protein MreD [Clostridium oceanicum]|uniref:Rod shape-determining protein MreD n=1 Tax=Clostridium oceanicum TaxID=1543 RepID=A0ABP3V4S3_9CLOT